MKAKKNIVLRKKVYCHLYEVSIWLVVARDALKARIGMMEEFDSYDGPEFQAVCSWYGNNFGVFFPAADVRHRDIGHELHHCSQRILQRCGDRLSDDRPEPHAYLNGWLHAWVYKALKGAKIRIT